MDSHDSAFSHPLTPPANLTGTLIARLTDDIIAGDLSPGTRLPTEFALMRAHGVSRTVIREAIAALRAEGLVETRQGLGAFVSADPRKRPFRIDPKGLRSIEQVLSVMELRICVEVEAAGLAARRRTAPDLAQLTEASRAFAAAIAIGDEAIDADFDFHAAIGAATGNAYFTSFLGFLGRLIIPRRSIHISQRDGNGRMRYMERVRAEHDQIAAAIAEGNVAGARRAMRIHLKRGSERCRRAAAVEKAVRRPERG